LQINNLTLRASAFLREKKNNNPICQPNKTLALNTLKTSPKKGNKSIDIPFKICYPELDKEELS
jgi:hypothetical protein